MFNFKQIAAAVAMGGVVVSAAAETTGNAGVVSEYMFRGIETSNGAAVQGGIDWAHDSGLTVGAWASNAITAGDSSGTELDVYAGFNGTVGDFGYEAGAIYYYFSEFDEGSTTATCHGCVSNRIRVTNLWYDTLCRYSQYLCKLLRSRGSRPTNIHRPNCQINCTVIIDISCCTCCRTCIRDEYRRWRRHWLSCTPRT